MTRQYVVICWDELNGNMMEEVFVPSKKKGEVMTHQKQYEYLMKPEVKVELIERMYLNINN